MISRLYPFIARLANLESSEPLYLVGGTVRDLLLNHGNIKDVDVISPKHSDRVARSFADAEGGDFFYLDEKRRISRVVIVAPDGRWQFDFSDYEGSDLDQDLGRRDFTINAMAVALSEFVARQDIRSCNVIDRFNGRKDLESRTLRLITPQALEQDPLRMLRAVRLSSELDFTIDSDSCREIQIRSHRIKEPAGERVRDELFRIFSRQGIKQYVGLLENLGLLEYLFPELLPLRGFSPGRHHRFDILSHSILTAEYADQTLQDLCTLAVHHADRIRAHMQSLLEQDITRMAAVRFAAIFHDIAKHETLLYDKDGEVHFYGHDQVGADITASICRRLRLSNTTTTVIDKLVRHHMRLLQLSRINGPSRRSLYRYCRDLKDVLPESIVLSLADGKATLEAMSVDEFLDTGRTAAAIVEYYYEKYLNVRKSPLISGIDLINLGMKPGPHFREILDDVCELQSDGVLRSRKEALDYIQRKTQK